MEDEMFETTFENVSITIPGKGVEAYKILCEAMDKINAEYETDTFTERNLSQHANVLSGDTSALWPCTGRDDGIHVFEDDACSACGADQPKVISVPQEKGIDESKPGLQEPRAD